MKEFFEYSLYGLLALLLIGFVFAVANLTDYIKKDIDNQNPKN